MPTYREREIGERRGSAFRGAYLRSTGDGDGDDDSDEQWRWRADLTCYGDGQIRRGAASNLDCSRRRPRPRW